MLSDSNVFAVIGVKDIDKAKEFYEGTLGLEPDPSSPDPGGVMYTSGNSRLQVYKTQYGGTNQATSASWKVDDVEGKVEALKAKGVTFEQYDMPGITRNGDVHEMGPLKAAWFKDPEGNVLCIANMG
jgi:catechol 2,3-dioxygenase-like lactoylglutathione lyase family enzyme